jgi:hypothetical protein
MQNFQRRPETHTRHKGSNGLSDRFNLPLGHPIVSFGVVYVLDINYL